MGIKLNLEDRYFISMYARRLICTMKLRSVIDKFFAQIEITPEEFKKYGVVIDSKTLEFSCTDCEYTVEYNDFPSPVIESMKKYISMFDYDKVKNNEMLQKTFKYFRKLI